MQDLTQPVGAGNPVNITQSPGSNEDRPAWAPNGTHIAFERDNGVPADRDIVVSLTNGGGQTNITNTAGAIEGKPAWDPTSSTIYYEKGNAQNPAVNTDIVRRSISFPGGTPTVGAETLAVADDADHPEIQPAISPNGDKICYGTGYPGVSHHRHQGCGAHGHACERVEGLDEYDRLLLHLVARQHDGRLHGRRRRRGGPGDGARGWLESLRDPARDRG